jgi:exonuclease SbcC
LRPRLLEIEGFSSFRQKRTIDFSGVQIFSITGENGAGKSSLLESIIFALYGETPRFVRDKRELVSLGNDELNVLFEFSVGENIYRVSRRFRLKVGGAYVTVEQHKKSGWVTLGEGEATVDDQISRIIGMSARAFTQAVIIPQGRFDVFLRPKQPKDRTDTLTEMFHLEMYEKMRKRAAEITSRAKEDIARITSDLAGAYSGATEDNLRQLKEQKKGLKEKEKELKTAVSDLKKRSSRISSVLETVKNLQKQSEKVEELQQDHVRETKNHNQCGNELLRWQKKEEPKIEVLQVQADGLPAVIQTLKELRRLQERLGKTDKKIAEDTRNLLSLSQAFEKDKKAKAQQDRLHKSLVDQLDSIAYEEEVWEKLNSLQGRVADLRSIRDQINGNNEASGDQLKKMSPLKGRLKVQHTAEQDKKKEVASLEEQLRLKDRLVHVHELRTGLKPGDQCPVCEKSIDDLHAPSKTEMKRLQKEIEGLSSSLEHARDELEDTINDRVSTEGALRAVETLLQDYGSSADKLKEKEKKSIANLNQQFPTPSDKDVISFLEIQYEKQNSLRSKYHELSAKIQDSSRSLNESRGDLERAQSKLSAIEEGLLELKNQAKELRSEIDNLQNDKEVKVYLKQAKNSDETIQSAETRQRDLRAQIHLISKTGRDLQNELSVSAGKLAILSNNQKKEQDDLSELQNLFSIFSDEEKGWDDSDKRRVDLEYENTLQEQQKLSKKLGELESDLAKMHEGLEYVSQLTKQKKEAEKQRDLYGSLAGYLEVRQLQKYVVGKLLQTLVENANVYLNDLTENKYQLRVVKEDLVIRDMWSGGGERSTKGLSGGETFVISLALALALSSALGQGIHIESLFLDEGFGSLDKGRLELVRDALLKLPLYDKVVGVVTHIDDFAKAFPSQFMLVNTAEGTEVTRIGESVNS